MIRDVILREIVIFLRIFFTLSSDELFEVFLEIAQEYLVVLGREQIRDPAVIRLKMAQKVQENRLITRSAAICKSLSGMPERGVYYV